MEGDYVIFNAFYLKTIISIHALRVEGDLLGATTQNTFKFISIHALRVEGDGLVFSKILSVTISIHALRVEGDLWCYRWYL